jgi:TolA-binding protein
MAEENIPEEQSNRLEAFILQNQKLLSVGLSVVLIAIVGYLGVTQWYIPRQNEKAQEEIYHAQQYFQQDSLDLALKGDAANPGFRKIAQNYSWTKTGNLAHYYTGIILLKKGDYSGALDYLGSFETNSDMLKPLAFGAMGDAYSEQDNYSQAANYYLKAANSKDNSFTSPIYLMKAGLVLEESQKYEKALSTYKKLKNNYPESNQASNIQKYISRVKTKLYANKS